jgi:hypothetical protein
LPGLPPVMDSARRAGLRSSTAVLTASIRRKLCEHTNYIRGQHNGAHGAETH